jgi:uncharacterized protein (DUF924 family)
MQGPVNDQTVALSCPILKPPALPGILARENDMSTQNSGEGAVPPAAKAVLDFWISAGKDKWFHGDEEFDQDFRERYLPLYEAATQGDLAEWSGIPVGALSLILLLDQFPRNAFRGTPRAYSSDVLARQTAGAAIAAGHDRRVDPDLRGFFYMPFMHSESIADQDRSVALQSDLAPDWRRPAARHRDIIARFGRFPHRNRILGRATTPEEKRYLDDGGFSR